MWLTASLAELFAMTLASAAAAGATPIRCLRRAKWWKTPLVNLASVYPFYKIVFWLGANVYNLVYVAHSPHYPDAEYALACGVTCSSVDFVLGGTPKSRVVAAMGQKNSGYIFMLVFTGIPNVALWFSSLKYGTPMFWMRRRRPLSWLAMVLAVKLVSLSWLSGVIYSQYHNDTPVYWILRPLEYFATTWLPWDVRVLRWLFVSVRSLCCCLFVF